LREVLQQMDRTVQERTADLAHAKSKAEHASRAKTAFLAHMSHEIRTPMNGVIGVAALLADTPLTADQRELLDVIRSSGDLLMTIINDILDLSKVEAGRLELEMRPVDVRKLAADAYRLFEPLAQRKGIALKVTVAEDAPPRLVSDPTRLNQILTNLMSNAIKFTSAGSVDVTIKAAAAEDGGRLTLVVRDTGPGIAPERLGQLFSPFSQGDASISRRYGGTGLGLVISRRLAELLGGFVTASSTPGVGSTFEASVRYAAASADAEVSPQPAAPRHVRPLRVLLAEDNPTNQLVASRLLSRAGHTVVLAQDGEEAVAAAGRERFDVILMDIQMPNLDGIEATRRIRKEHADAPPIVAMTANVFDDDRAAAMNAGMCAIVPKPLRGDVLTNVLASLDTAA
jgi:CheY-like chemotaxis protein